MSAISSRELYQLLKDKLNLPPRVLSMSIELKAGEPATMTVIHLVDQDEGPLIAEAVSKYQLVSVGAQIKPETLDQKLDRMADEAKAAICAMADAALAKLRAPSGKGRYGSRTCRIQLGFT